LKVLEQSILPITIIGVTKVVKSPLQIGKMVIQEIVVLYKKMAMKTVNVFILLTSLISQILILVIQFL
jgi:hypothetical protein